MQFRETKFNAGHVRTGFHDAWNWWISELASMIPSAIKQALVQPKEFNVVYIDGPNISVRHFDGLHANEMLQTSLEEVNAKDAPTKHQTAIIALSPSVAFTGKYRIPTIAQNKLRQAVALEVGRRSPFRSAGEFFDFIVVGNQDNGKILDIEWATAPADLISKAQSTVQKLGYVATAVGIAPIGERKLKFTFSRQKPTFDFHLKTSTIVLLFSIFMFLGSLFYSAYNSHEKAQSADLKIAALKVEAENAERAKAKVETLENAVQYIAQRAAEPKILEIMRSTTDALPDGTWVSEFNLNGSQLRLAGYSAAASSLPEQLTNVPLFLHPQFRAPITPQANAQGDKTIDHFDIGLTINNRHAAGDGN